MYFFEANIEVEESLSFDFSMILPTLFTKRAFVI